MIKFIGKSLSIIMSRFSHEFDQTKKMIKMKLFTILAAIIGICIIFAGDAELICCLCQPTKIADGDPGPVCKKCACANEN